jgi:hypothetical protein
MKYSLDCYLFPRMLRIANTTRGAGGEASGSWKDSKYGRQLYEFTVLWIDDDDENGRPTGASIPLASFRRYELSEDTLAQICEADNSARHQPMRKVGEEGWSDEGGGAERRERERERVGRVERAAGSVAGASNYSAINNPRVTRVIGPLSLRPPRRSPVRLPSFLATNPRRYQCSWYVNAIVPVCRRHLSLRGTRIDRLHDGIL